MAELSLWFASGERIELVRTTFRVAADSQIVATVRGRSSNGHCVGTFSWSPAVKALTILVLKHFLSGENTLSNSETASLSGEAGSAASSLDYAIAKQPNWILDMFGITEDGASVLRSLVSRVNPEQKRPGPVQLTLRTSELPPKAIKIYVDDKIVETPTAVTHLLYLIESQASTPKNTFSDSHSSSVNPFAPVSPYFSDNCRSALHELFTNEIFGMLRQTNIFSKTALRESVDRVKDNPSFAPLVKRDKDLLSEIDRQLTSANRLGLDNRNSELLNCFTPEKPLRVSLTPALTGAIAILTYLRDFENIPIEFNYGYSLGGDIVSQLETGELENIADATVLSIASAGRVLSSRTQSFLPLMMMPQLSHRVLSSRSHRSIEPLNGTTLLMVTDEPSTPSFVFDDLCRTHFATREKVTLQNFAPDEVTEMMHHGSSELRTILGFPHYALLELFVDCQALAFKERSYFPLPSVLFLQAHYLTGTTTARFLDVAIRNAWLTLLESPSILDAVVSTLLHTEDYLRAIYRRCGIFQLHLVNKSEHVLNC